VAAALRQFLRSVVERDAWPRERAGSPLQAYRWQALSFPWRLILLCEQGSAHGFQLFLFCFVHVWE
jgi:hypothetical protein